MKTIKINKDNLVIEWDNYEGRILDGEVIIAKIYACSDGLHITSFYGLKSRDKE